MKKEKPRPQSNNKKSGKPSFTGRITVNKIAWPVFFLFVFLIYGQLLGFFLGKLDEDLLILGNLNLLKDFSNIRLAFLSDAFLSKEGSSFYRPLQTLSFMADAHFFFRQGSVYYFTNMVIHALTGCALFYFLKQLSSKNDLTAFLLTLLFLASPLFVQAVAWAPSRGDMLLGFFAILAMIGFLKFIRSGHFSYAGLSTLMFLMAMFSKETAIVIPVVMAVFLFIPSSEKKTGIRDNLLIFVMMLMAAGFYFFMRAQAIRSSPPDVFGIPHLLYNLRTIPEFIAKFFLPVNLSPMAGFTLWNTLAGCILIALLVFLLIRGQKAAMLNTSAGIFWFLLFTLPGAMYSHTLGSSAYDYLEHRAYVPAMGLIIMIFFLTGTGAISAGKNMLSGILISLTLVFAVYAHLYSRNYRDPLEFYNLAVETNPNSALARLNRGNLRMQSNDLKGAMEDNTRAIAINHRYAQAWVNLGINLGREGRTDEAISAYDSAVKFHPRLFQAHYNRANMLMKKKMYAEALKEYNTALGINPDYHPGYVSRSMVHYNLGDFQAAISDINLVLKFSPDNADAWLNRGKIWYAMKNRPNACADWKQAEALGSDEARNLVRSFCQPPG